MDLKDGGLPLHWTPGAAEIFPSQFHCISCPFLQYKTVRSRSSRSHVESDRL